MTSVRVVQAGSGKSEVVQVHVLEQHELGWEVVAGGRGVSRKLIGVGA